MFPWKKIETVLLDMDGTLLDLHFDNYFWLQLVPEVYAKKHQLTVDEGKEQTLALYQQVAGTLDWYCLDYWTKTLGMDIPALKATIKHKIAVRPDTLPFLKALRQTGRKLVLVTNAHPDSLSIKMEKTGLAGYFDLLISTHELGYAKESQKCWQALQSKVGFNKTKTLFVDDSLSILKSAQTFGISHLLTVTNPDSRQPAKQQAGYLGVSDFTPLLPQILASPIEQSM